MMIWVLSLVVNLNETDRIRHVFTNFLPKQISPHSKHLVRVPTHSSIKEYLKSSKPRGFLLNVCFNGRKLVGKREWTFQMHFLVAQL